ncbi:MAG TPA: ZIP family metal transporter [Rhizomicrobium sp.]|nr:ZIP family metal transporter [Rhizomicrobium sp.]
MPATLIMLIALGTCASTLAGGAMALHLRDRLHLILGFSAGAIIALSFFDLLPEAIRIGGARMVPADVLAVAAAGFFGYAVLDRLILLHSHHHDGGASLADSAALKRQWLGAGSLSVHSFLDGFAIGIAFRASPAIGIVVAAAVLAHDFSDGMNTVNLVLKNNGAPGQASRWLVIDAVAPVLGAAASFFVSLPGGSLSLVLGLFAGFFLYIGASDLLPESYHAHPKFLTTVMTLLGAGLLYLVVRLAG